MGLQFTQYEKIESGSLSSIYKLYDSNENEIAISNWTISGLENAYYYTKGANDTTKKRIGGRIFYINSDIAESTSTDKFYVYDNTTHSTTDGTTTWSATDGLVSSQRWGYYNTSCGCTSNAIGSGKTNTNTILTKGVPTDWTPNIWAYISACRSTSLNGCTDWYIGSVIEIDQLKSSGLQSTWFTSNNIHSSTEYLYRPVYYYYWAYGNGTWVAIDKTMISCCFAIRSF